MRLIDGWLDAAEPVPSPNFNERPAEQEPSLLVVHCISLPPGHFGSGDIRRFFQNQLDSSAHPFYEEIKGLKVSAHFLIERNGHLVQFVATDKRAWHAGKSNYKGCDDCNNFSIGVELEGCDDQAYSDEQYHSLTALCAYLIDYYPKLTRSRLCGHSDIAPGRKSDPGPAFDWGRLQQLLRQAT
ncbi:1,6-anhydro-N-acetylmuramyl-L-alanine amidase AmpD [Agaribacterium haliotis]|uniref:1,6-anhydro-N-acetylmuramyl-L-alanine amidase AmpD n=1 Tax=Agaribacterium haliotis TaxID=2013869 RepID=UPI000BB5607B|nr:1,6-anhydro-N-acetylmuramyl-L-alanine amidase AmpD [Agaribacterium haliotis]